MNYDIISGLPTYESFIDFSEKMWTSRNSERFAILSVYFGSSSSRDSSLSHEESTMFVHKFIRANHHYMLSACKYSKNTFIVLIDKTYLPHSEITQYISESMNSFCDNLRTTGGVNNTFIIAGLCHLNSDIEFISDGIAHSLLALHSIPFNQNNCCNVAVFDTNSHFIQSHSNSYNQKILPMFEDITDGRQVLIYLQPKFELDLENPVGAEALVRILDNNGALLRPKDFLYILEDNKLSDKLDLIVIEKVMKLLTVWKMNHIVPLPISINLSNPDFNSTYFKDILIEILEKYNDVKDLVEFEISEDTYFSDSDAIKNGIKFLREAGQRVVLDGLGKSGIIQINTSIPSVNTIKYNQNIIQTAMKNEDDFLLLKNSFKLCEDCNISIIYEGIETKEVEDFARECNIRYVQGYYYSRPLPVDNFQKRYLEYSPLKHRA